LISWQRAVLGMLLLTACGASTFEATPGEGSSAPPCDRIIPGCEARRLENVVLRNGAEDGALFSVDGLDTRAVLTFDEALEAGWKNDYRGDGETVQVILGAADADRLRWGTGTNLYFAVEWGGTCPLKPGGPAGFEPPPEAFECDAMYGTVLDAHTGEFIVGGQSDPP